MDENNRKSKEPGNRVVRFRQGNIPEKVFPDEHLIDRWPDYASDIADVWKSKK